MEAIKNMEKTSKTDSSSFSMYIPYLNFAMEEFHLSKNFKLKMMMIDDKCSKLQLQFK